MTSEVRCPHCGKLLAEWLEGRLKIVCGRCKTRLVIDNRPKGD